MNEARKTRLEGQGTAIPVTASRCASSDLILTSVWHRGEEAGLTTDAPFPLPLASSRLTSCPVPHGEFFKMELREKSTDLVGSTCSIAKSWKNRVGWCMRTRGKNECLPILQEMLGSTVTQ